MIGRVARRIWAMAMRERYGASERSQKLKYHVQTSGRSLHAREMAFNDIRTTLQALLAIQDHCNSLHTNAYDEAVTTPTPESVRRALAIQLIIQRELGLAMNENALQGSYLIEELTDLVEEAVLARVRAASPSAAACSVRWRRSTSAAASRRRACSTSRGSTRASCRSSASTPSCPTPPTRATLRADAGSCARARPRSARSSAACAPSRRATPRRRRPALRAAAAGGAPRRQRVRRADADGEGREPRPDQRGALRGRRPLPAGPVAPRVSFAIDLATGDESMAKRRPGRPGALARAGEGRAARRATPDALARETPGRPAHPAALHRGGSRGARVHRHAARACSRSCAARAPRCTPTAPGRCASTPASRPPRSRTPSTAPTWPPGSRASRWPSTSPPTAATTRTTRACAATSARPASRSTPSRT